MLLPHRRRWGLLLGLTLLAARAVTIPPPAEASPPGLQSRQSPGRIQALAPPGSLTLPPEGYGVLVWPAPGGSAAAGFGGLREIFVHNRSDQTATIAADDSTLTITVPQGYIAVPDASCTPGADASVTDCPLAEASFINFDAADAAHPQPLPQHVSLGRARSVALSTTDSAIAAVAVAYDTFDVGNASADAVDVAWDGSDLVISAPEGYRIVFSRNPTYPDQGCTPNDDVPTAVTCPAMGQPPRLFHVGTQSLKPNLFPPGALPGVSATIVSPTTSDQQTVGQPVTFAAGGRPDLAYIWTFGDGAIEVGQTVQHSYAARGLYKAELTVIGGDFLGQSTVTQLVSVGEAPVSVTYPAGWNLIGVPKGTNLTDALGPLYTTNFCSNAPGPVPPGVATQSCSPDYRTVSPDQMQVLGAGYWAYFPRPTTITLPFVDDQFQVSYQPGSWFMAGNPTYKPAVVRGADTVMVYDPTTGGYRQTDTLQPGQGAWVYSASGALISIHAAPPVSASCTSSPSQPSPAWYQRCPSSSPPLREAARAVYDPARGNVVLFGGSNFEQNAPFGDTWLWDGTTWTQARPAASPSPRNWPALAYDDALGQVVLFGGAGPGSLGDTWSWDGTTWTEQHPAVSPPPRYNAAMAYDAARRELVLFGGFGEGGVRGGYLADTWTYDGTSWTPVCGTDGTPDCGPPPGLGNAMAYDTLRHQILMFGGSNGDNYTWTWDGSRWTLQQPATAPPAPQFGTLVFEPSLGGMVFVGSSSFGFSTAGSQVWLWDGADWRQLQVSASPAARHDPAVAHDPAGGILLFGGGWFVNRVEQEFGDTWVLR